MTTKKRLSYPLLHKNNKSITNNYQANSTTTAGRLRILLADVDPEIANLLKAFLDREKDFPKFEVISSTTKIQSIQKLLFEHFNLIIIDIRFSRDANYMDGIDLLQELRKQILMQPVIIFSALKLSDIIQYDHDHACDYWYVRKDSEAWTLLVQTISMLIYLQLETPRIKS